MRKYAEIALNLAAAIFSTIGTCMAYEIYGWGMLRFYTVNSNILAAIACLLQALFRWRHRKGKEQFPKWLALLKYASVCCLMVTFLVVVFVLAPMIGEGGLTYLLFTRDMLYHHLLCPVTAFFAFLLFDRLPLAARRSAMWAMLPTGVYAVVLLALNVARVLKGPYPFLHVYEQPWWMTCVWAVVICGGAYLLALFLARLGRKRVQ